MGPVEAVGQEPLGILEKVAVDDLRYTELVTGDWTMANETLGQMFRSPRVLFGLARHQLMPALGRTTVPYGFDPLLDPPDTDYSDHTSAEKFEVHR